MLLLLLLFIPSTYLCLRVKDCHLLLSCTLSYWSLSAFYFMILLWLLLLLSVCVTPLQKKSINYSPSHVSKYPVLTVFPWQWSRGLPFSVAADCAAICLHLFRTTLFTGERRNALRWEIYLWVGSPSCLLRWQQGALNLDVVPDDEVLFIISESEGFTELFNLVSPSCSITNIFCNPKINCIFFSVYPVYIANIFKEHHCSILML